MKLSLWIMAALAVLVMTVFAGCEKKPTAEAPPPAPKPLAAAAPAALSGVIAAVGDSLTEGYGVDEEKAYPALLEQKLRASGHNYSVINAGISGETSSGTLSRVRWILALKPDIVILETGANDGLRGIDPNLTRENIREVVRILKGEGVVVVLAGMEMVRNLGADFTGAFREIYTTVGRGRRRPPRAVFPQRRGGRPPPKPGGRHSPQNGGLPNRRGDRLPIRGRCHRPARSDATAQVNGVMPGGSCSVSALHPPGPEM